MAYTFRFFPLQNAVCFIILTYLVPVLFTFYIQSVLKLKKNNSGAKRLNTYMENTDYFIYCYWSTLNLSCTRKGNMLHELFRSAKHVSLLSIQSYRQLPFRQGSAGNRLCTLEIYSRRSFRGRTKWGSYLWSTARRLTRNDAQARVPCSLPTHGCLCA